MSVSKKHPSVLLLTNSFSTGGVETHILSLAAALKARGYFVAVASAGGSLEDALEKQGILHIFLPLDRRSAYNLLLARRLLIDAVKTYRFDILHAHSRLSAFAVSLLPKSLRRHFVTTAHLDFEVTPITRFFSRWGEKTLAVSEDIRAYLVREYGLSYARIFLTVNGIDTETFSKETLPAPNTSAPIILHISRMDEDRAATAFLLCDLMPALCERYPAKLIIVGGGSLLPALEKRVANDALLRDTVSVVGEAVDVTPYLAIATVFVGVSRAALEAMACGIPTVLSGNSGYLGIYRSEMLAEAAASNFCCRSAALPNASRLCRDLAYLLGAKREELSALSNECRNTVLAHYSLDKMTNDYEAFYASLTPKKKACRNVILGYHGFGNLGDELLLENMIAAIRRIDPEGGIAVISQNASKTACDFDITAVSRRNLPSVFCALFRARVLYVGGGTLLQKETSRRSYYYYAFWIALAKRLGKRVVYYANGLGDFSKKDEPSLARLLSGRCVVTLRDAESFALCERLCAKMREDKKPYLALTADSALTLEPLPEIEASCLFSAHRLPKDTPYFLLALSGRRCKKRMEEALAKACVMACEKGYLPVFLLMQPASDASLAKSLAETVFVRTGKKAPILTLPPRGALSLAAGACFLVTSRFHALVFGAMAELPLLCLSQSEKCRRFCHEIGVASACLPSERTEEALLYALPFLMEKHPRFIADREAVARLTALAKTTPEKICEGFAYLEGKTKKTKLEKTIERFKIKER